MQSVKRVRRELGRLFGEESTKKSVNKAGKRHHKKRAEDGELKPRGDGQHKKKRHHQHNNEHAAGKTDAEHHEHGKHKRNHNQQQQHAKKLNKLNKHHKRQSYDDEMEGSGTDIDEDEHNEPEETELCKSKGDSKFLVLKNF